MEKTPLRPRRALGASSPDPSGKRARLRLAAFFSARPSGGDLGTAPRRRALRPHPRTAFGAVPRRADRHLKPIMQNVDTARSGFLAVQGCAPDACRYGKGRGHCFWLRSERPAKSRPLREKVGVLDRNGLG